MSWGWRLATLPLAPVLLVQGRRVRRVTPRLPEAAGAREGVVRPDDRGSSAVAPLLRLLILGDSSAAGVGVDTQDRALAGCLSRELAKTSGRPVQWRVVARNGARLADVLRMLADTPDASVDLAVLAVGVNDATGGTRPAAWLAGLDTLRATLDTRFGAPALLVSALPPMARFPALPFPLSAWLGARAARLDRLAAAWARTAPRTRHQPVHFDQDASLMASDGFHPGEPGCRTWAEQLAVVALSVVKDAPA